MSETIAMFQRCAEAQYRGMLPGQRAFLDVLAMKYPQSAACALSTGAVAAECKVPVWMVVNDRSGRALDLISVKW